MDELYMMWLSRIMGLGSKKAMCLLEYFKTPSAIWLASASELAEAPEIGYVTAESIVKSKKYANFDKWIKELKENHISFVSMLHKEYPYLLSQIYDPPIVIYIKGRLPKSDANAVSIVGARRCSQYGANVAYKLAKDLTKANIVIVSGMARGIDTMAHRGAMDGDGQTIAVLGCGLDICYPPENEGVMKKIIETGCIISEYQPQTPPHAKNFPNRNRIISGLSSATIVVEAAKRSGTLITTKQALENGREVFVVPGNITSVLSEGTNNLIKEGCPIITNFHDVLDELKITYNEEDVSNYKKKLTKDISPLEHAVYSCIGLEPIQPEEIARKIQENISGVQYSLTILEILGAIRKLPQSGYIRED